MSTINEPTNLYYLLSTISQSLATILSLIFSAILIAGQLASHYNPALPKNIFNNKFTTRYLLIFIVGIASSLIILWFKEIDTWIFLILISLTVLISLICLALIIPYFRFIIKLFDPKTIIDDLTKKANEKLKKETTKLQDALPEQVFVLREVIFNSFSNRNYDIYKNGIDKLIEVLLEISSLLGRTNEIEIDCFENAIINNISNPVDRQFILDCYTKNNKGKYVLKEPIKIEDEERISNILKRLGYAENKVPKMITELLNIFKYIGILVKEDLLATEGLLNGLSKCAVVVKKLDTLFNHNLFSEIIEEISIEIEEVIFRIEKNKDEPFFERICYITNGLGFYNIENKNFLMVKKIVVILYKMSEIATINNKWDKAALRCIRGLYLLGDDLLNDIDVNDKLRINICIKVLHYLRTIYRKSITAETKSASEHYIKKLWDKVLNSNLKEVIEMVLHHKKDIVIINIENENRDNKIEVHIEEMLNYCNAAVEKLPDLARTYIILLKSIWPYIYKLNDQEDLLKKIIQRIGTIGEAEYNHLNKSKIVKCSINSLISLFDENRNMVYDINLLIVAELCKISSYYLDGKDLVVSKLKYIENKIGLNIINQGFDIVIKWDINIKNMLDFINFYKSST